MASRLGWTVGITGDDLVGAQCRAVIGLAPQDEKWLAGENYVGVWHGTAEDLEERLMATEKAETDRVPVTLALSTITYLERLVRQGTHGTSVPGVARTLIEEGIRLAIKDGLLAIRDNGKSS